MAYVTRLRDFALAHPPQGNHPHLNQRLRQVDATSFAPQAADLAEARAFADAQLGHGAVVEPAGFTPAAWGTQDKLGRRGRVRGHPGKEVSGRA